MIRSLWRLVVVALVGAAAMGPATAAWATTTADDCAVVASTAHTTPATDATAGPQLRVQIDAPRRTVAQPGGGRVDVAPCRTGTADRPGSTPAVDTDVVADPSATAHRAVGDRAPPAS